MSEEIDKIEGICQDCIHLNKIMPIIEQLQQENKKLKETLENNSKINVADHKYASEMEDKYLIEHNILTEFEKWLEKQKENIKFPVCNTNYTHAQNVGYYCASKDCLDKLQELKEGNK